MARIAGINIPQNKLVHIGLTYIYGIGDKFSNQICSSLEIPKAKRINELTDDEILKIREYIDANFKVEGDLRRDYSLTIKRYDTYMEITRPVLNYYSKNLNFHEINGTQEIDQITKEIEAFIDV